MKNLPNFYSSALNYNNKNLTCIVDAIHLVTSKKLIKKTKHTWDESVAYGLLAELAHYSKKIDKRITEYNEGDNLLLFVHKMTKDFKVQRGDVSHEGDRFNLIVDRFLSIYEEVLTHTAHSYQDIVRRRVHKTFVSCISHSSQVKLVHDYHASKAVVESTGVTEVEVVVEEPKKNKKKIKNKKKKKK